MESIRKKRGGAGIRLCLAFCLALGLAGCAAGNWGRLVHSKELMSGLRENTLPANLNYYYCGRSSLPDAVVGIDPAYDFVSRFWFKIESTVDVHDKIYHLSDLEPGHDRVHAKDIIGPGRVPVGVWFSYYNTTAVKVDEVRKTVWVANPYKPATRFVPGS